MENDKIAYHMEKMLKWLVKNQNATPDEYVNHFIEDKCKNDKIPIETCQNDKKPDVSNYNFITMENFSQNE